jgi:hypothetical protein
LKGKCVLWPFLPVLVIKFSIDHLEQNIFI